jgi:Domain of unknown function (DUF4157)/Protein-glutamine gamma-glutamyltransferase
MSEHDRQPATERTERPESPGAGEHAPAPGGGAGAWSEPGLAHRTAGDARVALVLGAQHGQGNAWVARALAQRQAADDDAPAPESAAAGLIVADDVAPAAGQMAREAFLTALREAAATAAAEELDGTIWALTVDSGVDEWLAPYRELDAAALEAAVRAKVRGAAGARDAAALVAATGAAVRAEVARRLVSDEAEEAQPPLSLDDLPGARAAAEVAQILFKRAEGSPAQAADPLAVRRRLGGGSPLDGSVRSRMEPALGVDLAGVRVHTDTDGARVAGELGARAFATGRHVAFGAGEYAPGTPVGDALLAHELAHVAQQDGGSAGPVGEAALEHDADASAAGAMAALWAPGHPAAARLQRRPRLRDGLALRRCTPDKAKSKDAAPPGKDAGPVDDPEPKEPRPANPKAVYDQKLQEAMPKIKARFGRAEKGMFDKDYWEKIDVQGGESELQLLPGRWPSDAISAMVDKPDKWTLDCAQAVQLAHLYALRHALGATDFNKRVGRVGFRFRPHDSTGVEGATEWWRPGLGTHWKRFPVDPAERKLKPQGDDETRNDEQLLDAAPVGSRVMFTNQMADSSSSFHHENTYKLGRDSYAAHGFKDRKVFDRASLELALAQAFRKDADDAFVKGNIYVQAIETYKSDLPAGVPAAPE